VYITVDIFVLLLRTLFHHNYKVIL